METQCGKESCKGSSQWQECSCQHSVWVSTQFSSGRAGKKAPVPLGFCLALSSTLQAGMARCLGPVMLLLLLQLLLSEWPPLPQDP